MDKPKPDKPKPDKPNAASIGCLVVFGLCVYIVIGSGECSDWPPEGPDCTRQYAAWDALENRREALEANARSLIEIAAARRLEAAAKAEWQACTER